MTEKKQQHKKKRGKVQHIRGSPKKRKISGKAVFSSESIPGSCSGVYPIQPGNLIEKIGKHQIGEIS